MLYNYLEKTFYQYKPKNFKFLNFYKFKYFENDKMSKINYII